MTAEGQPPTLEGPAAALYDAVEATIEPWLERLVVETARRRLGKVPEAVSTAARRTAASTAPDVLRRVRALLATDVDVTSESFSGLLGMGYAVLDGPKGIWTWWAA